MFVSVFDVTSTALSDTGPPYPGPIVQQPLDDPPFLHRPLLADNPHCHPRAGHDGLSHSESAEATGRLCEGCAAACEDCMLVDLYNTAGRSCAIKQCINRLRAGVLQHALHVSITTSICMIVCGSMICSSFYRIESSSLQTIGTRSYSQLWQSHVFRVSGGHVR